LRQGLRSSAFVTVIISHGIFLTWLHGHTTSHIKTNEKSSNYIKNQRRKRKGREKKESLLLRNSSHGFIEKTNDSFINGSNSRIIFALWVARLDHSRWWWLCVTWATNNQPSRWEERTGECMHTRRNWWCHPTCKENWILVFFI
jgi:hypothetical protein